MNTQEKSREDYANPSKTGLSIKARARWIASEHLIWVILLALVLFGLSVDGFASQRNFINVLWAASPLGMMVLGLYFVMIAGRLDLSLESSLVFAPTVAIVAMTEWFVGMDPLLAIAITILVGALVGIFNGLVSVILGVNAFLVTLATLIIMRGAVVCLIPEGVYNLPEIYTDLGGTRLFSVFPLAVIVLVIAFLISYLIMKRTAFGRSLIGIGNNEEACRVAGINVKAVLIGAFMLAGICSSIGGLLQVGRLFSVDATMGEGDILIVFAAVTLGGTALTGGRGSVSGLLGAILVIGLITNLMNLIGVAVSIQEIVFGAVLLIAIILSSVQDRLRSHGA